MSVMNQRQQNANTAGIDHKLKKFVLNRCIWFILSVILVIGWFSLTFPVKLFIYETSGRLEHFDKQNEDKRRPNNTVRQILNFDQYIPHIRDEANIVPINSSSPLQANRFEVQIKITFSGSNDDVL